MDIHTLLKALRSDDEVVCVNALIQLCIYFKDDAARFFFSEAMLHRFEKVRAKCAELLGETPALASPRETLLWLTGILADSDARVRKTAIESLARIDARLEFPPARGAILLAATTDTNSDVRATAKEKLLAAFRMDLHFPGREINTCALLGRWLELSDADITVRLTHLAAHGDSHAVSMAARDALQREHAAHLNAHGEANKSPAGAALVEVFLSDYGSNDEERLRDSCERFCKVPYPNDKRIAVALETIPWRQSISFELADAARRASEAMNRYKPKKLFGD
jgi:hypothetical protein